MHAFYIASIWLHILSATLWIGGSLFLVLVLMPVIRQSGLREQSMDLLHRAAIRFLWVEWSCFGILIATGIFNLLYRGIGWEQLMSAAFWQGSYGRALAWKLVLVVVIFLVSATHGFIVGPLATRKLQEDPTSEEAQLLRLLVRWVGRLNLLLGLVVVGLAVVLVRGWPW